MDIAKIDKNLAVPESVNREGLKTYDATEEPFEIYGVMLPDEKEDKFKRVPGEFAEKVSDGVNLLHARTAGGRVRFATNSGKIAIRAIMPTINRSSHFALTGGAGFDLYADDVYVKTFVPPYEMTEGYESEIVTDGKMHDYTINMPTYSEVSRLYIMLEEGAQLTEAAPYKYEKPVVYYGSSITQGGCASRPGSTYQAIVSRRVDCNFINLGFSGSAKGEESMAEYIADLDMSVFVCDYDHNAPTPEHLEKTHSNFVRIVREKNPDLPIICISMPDYHCSDEIAAKRRDIIKKTVDDAKAGGDKNIYFIDGRSFSADLDEPREITVDNCHPTDYGFALMGKKIAEMVKKVIK